MFNDPVILYGSSISYFTGKMENYFKVRGIPYKRVVAPYPSFEKKMKQKAKGASEQISSDTST